MEQRETVVLDGKHPYPDFTPRETPQNPSDLESQTSEPIEQSYYLDFLLCVIEWKPAETARIIRCMVHFLLILGFLSTRDGITYPERHQAHGMEFGKLVEPSSTLYVELQKTLIALCGEKMFACLLSEPASLRSKGCNTLGRHTYWVHESSLDAEQCLLLVMNEGSYFFLRNPSDARSPIVYTIEKESLFFPTAGDLSKHHHQTLIDGEFVYSYFYNKTVFCAHDALCINGRRVLHQSLPERLALIRDHFVLPLRARYTEAYTGLPFAILGKDYVPLDKLPTVFSHITQHSDTNGVRFVYNNGKRYNENKGITLVPDAPYNPLSRLQWIWPELYPVVFHARLEAAPFVKLSLVVPGTSSLFPYRTLNFGVAYSRLQEDFKGAKERTIACTHQDGEFKYQGVVSSDCSVSSMTEVLKYLEDVTTSVSRLELDKLAADKVVPPVRHNNNSPIQSKSPLTMSCSPDVELVTESPVGRSDSFLGGLKRPLGEFEVDGREVKRQRISLAEPH